MDASPAPELIPSHDDKTAAVPWHGPVLVAEDLSQQRLPARRMVAILRQAGLPADLVDVGPEGDTTRTCQENTIPLVELAHGTRPRLIVFSILFADHLSETLGAIGLCAGRTSTATWPSPARCQAWLRMSCWLHVPISIRSCVASPKAPSSSWQPPC